MKTSVLFFLTFLIFFILYSKGIFQHFTLIIRKKGKEDFSNSHAPNAAQKFMNLRLADWLKTNLKKKIKLIVIKMRKIVWK